MVPPQERPTFQAVSSATPNSRVFGLPLSITSIASVTTAPSTQPPETEPRKLPWSSITRLEPTGRGAEPQVSTTVARATPRPALFQSSAALRMSSSLASIGASIASLCPICGSHRYIYRNITRPTLRNLCQPGFRNNMTAMLRQRPAQLGHRIQVVNGPQFVNVRQHHPDAAGLGF